MFLTMKLGTLVRLVLAVALVVIVVVLTSARPASEAPMPDQPVPTERAAGS